MLVGIEAPCLAGAEVSNEAPALSKDEREKKKAQEEKTPLLEELTVLPAQMRVSATFEEVMQSDVAFFNAVSDAYLIALSSAVNVDDVCKIASGIMGFVERRRKLMLFPTEAPREQKPKDMYFDLDQ